MYLKELICILFLLNNHFIEGQNLTYTNETSTSRVIVSANPIKPQENTFRHLFFIFIGCSLTIFLIIAMVMSYNRIIEQRRNHSSTINMDIRNRFNTIIQTLGLNNLNKNGRFNFFSISNNNNSSNQHRQGQTSRTHLNENQDEALLFDDPYADGGVTGGIHNSSLNPYKSLTLSVT